MRLDDMLYCIIDRSIVEEQNYGNELRLLQSLHAAIDQVETVTASLN